MECLRRLGGLFLSLQYGFAVLTRQLMAREGVPHLRRAHRNIVDFDGVDEALVRRDVELSRPE